MTAPAAGTGSPAERRQHPRKNVIDSQLLTVALPGEDAVHRRGIVLDVSEGGMAVQPFVPLVPGSTSGIELNLAGSTPFKGTGLVAWVGPGGRAGIRFIDVPPEAREQLRRFLGVDSPEKESQQADTATGAAPAESDELDLDGALELIAERARDITSATGAAVALGDSNSMVCRASTGLAPDLGARLHRDAGLSGYCLRTGEVVHCADTLEDSRIDPAVAQQLNVRSILIVPVFAEGGISGLLEVLSSRPHAFEPRHIVRLQRVAQLLSGAIEENCRAAQGQASAGTTTEELTQEEPPQEFTCACGSSEPEAAVALPRRPNEFATDAPVSAAAVAAPALSMPVERQILGTTTATPPEVSLAEPAEPVPTQAAETVTVPPEPAAGEQLDTTAQQHTSEPAPVVEPPPVAAAAPVLPPAAPEQGEPEQVSEPSSTVPQRLELTPVRRAPQHSRARATGMRTVRADKRIHIGPVYLTSTMGPGGEVVLSATITTEGTLDNIRVVSGPKLLGSAAVATVSQWRCQPCQVNGGPVEVDTTITIHFAPAK